MNGYEPVATTDHEAERPGRQTRPARPRSAESEWLRDSSGYVLYEPSLSGLFPATEAQEEDMSVYRRKPDHAADEWAYSVRQIKESVWGEPPSEVDLFATAKFEDVKNGIVRDGWDYETWVTWWHEYCPKIPTRSCHTSGNSHH